MAGETRKKRGTQSRREVLIRGEVAESVPPWRSTTASHMACRPMRTRSTQTCWHSCKASSPHELAAQAHRAAVAGARTGCSMSWT